MSNFCFHFRSTAIWMWLWKIAPLTVLFVVHWPFENFQCSVFSSTISSTIVHQLFVLCTQSPFHSSMTGRHDLLNLHAGERCWGTSSRIFVKWMSWRHVWLFDFLPIVSDDRCFMIAFVGLNFTTFMLRDACAGAYAQRTSFHVCLLYLVNSAVAAAAVWLYISSCCKVKSTRLMHAVYSIIAVDWNYPLCIYLLFDICLENVCFRFRVLLSLMLMPFLSLSLFISIHSHKRLYAHTHTHLLYHSTYITSGWRK